MQLNLGPMITNSHSYGKKLCRGKSWKIGKQNNVIKFKITEKVMENSSNFATAYHEAHTRSSISIGLLQ